MSALTFDTHVAIKNLMAKGLPEAHAEAITETIKQAQDAHLEELATKGGISQLEHKVELSHKDLTIRIDRAVITLGGFMIALAGLLLAYLEFLG